LKRRSNPRERAILRLADHLHAAAIHLLRRLRRTDSSLEVKGPTLSALSVLVFGGPCSLGTLAQAEHVRRPTMSRLVMELEADGLVVRRPDPDDGRAILLQATPKGAELLEKGRALRIGQLAEQLQYFTTEELRTLEGAVALLERMLIEQRQS
jgi:DNA-binding MarR family transcriptional regulator